jgi:hypothetical protein
MPGSRGRLLPILVVGGVAAIAVGVAALVERLTAPLDPSGPAAPGTPQVGSRLPVGLWPSDGTEPIVRRGPAGWREMTAALYHRDTEIDAAALARAVVIASRSRREQDARRERALEAHVLRGAYDPVLIAAAWLHPLDARTPPSDLVSLGIGGDVLLVLGAAAELTADASLTATWRREFGLDVVDPRVTREIIADTPADRIPRLWAVLLELAEQRLLARQELRRT